MIDLDYTKFYASLMLNEKPSGPFTPIFLCVLKDLDPKLL